MAGRETEAVQRAVELVVTGGMSVSAAARDQGVNAASIHRAMRRRGIEPRGPVSGESHHAWKDGRRARRS